MVDSPGIRERYRQMSVEVTAADILDKHGQSERGGTYSVERSRRLGQIAKALGYMKKADFAQAVGDKVAQQTDQDVTVWTEFQYMGDSAPPERWPAKITIGDLPVFPNNNMRILWPPQSKEQ